MGLTDWAITFNAQKTLQQTFTNRRNNQPLALTFDGQDIPNVTRHKHLGLAFSTDLHFHEHINNVIRTINTMLGPIYPVAKFHPRNVFNDIYITYIRPHFDYCDIIYDGHLTSADALRLQTLQNRCARLITGALYQTPTTALLTDLGWEQLETRRSIHKLLFFHRIYYNSPPLPSYIIEIMTDTRQDATGLRLRNAQSLSFPPTNLTCFYRSYFPSAIRQWNLLPETLRNSASRKDFARQIWQRLGAPKQPTSFSVGNKTQNTLHTRLRVGMSTLNAHLFQVQHPNTPSPSFACGNNHENTNHFILWCPFYNTHRQKLFNSVCTIVPNFNNFSAKQKLDVLLASKDLSVEQGKVIALHFQTFISETRRFAN